MACSAVCQKGLSCTWQPKSFYSNGTAQVVERSSGKHDKPLVTQTLHLLMGNSAGGEEISARPTIIIPPMSGGWVNLVSASKNLVNIK
jgi:hypothetical protein